MNNYDRTNDAFERAVRKLRENLQYLADNKKVSSVFISMQNAIIKSLIDYQHQMSLIMSRLEMDIMQLSRGKSREFDKIKYTQTCLEAICIIHGITDFPAWLAKGRGYLVNEAVWLQKENTIRLPYQFLKMMEEKLSPDERETLKGILYRRVENEQQERIKQLMKELNAKLELLEKLRNAGA